MGNCLGNVIVEEYLSNVMFMDGGNSSTGGTPNPQAGNSNSQGGSSSSSRWEPRIANLLNPIPDDSNPQPENSNSQAGNSNTQVGNSNTNTNQNPSPNPSNDSEYNLFNMPLPYYGNGFTVKKDSSPVGGKYYVDNPTNINSFFLPDGKINRSDQNREYARCIHNAFNHFQKDTLAQNRVDFPLLDDNTRNWYEGFVKNRNPQVPICSIKNTQALRKDLLKFSRGN
jgi:hypothetical protein